MIKPVRLQRRRTKNFHLKSPNGLPVVYVGRPSRFGNPFRLSNGDCDHPDCGPKSHPPVTLEMAIAGFKDWITHHPDLTEIKAELRGKNLACWCPLDKPCHADVLLELANGETK